MSNALAVATVTQALALLIENNMRPEIDMAVSVETRRPPAEPPTEPTITVFLYQVTPNASMRHHDLPTRSSDGTLLKRPAAALDLHYLITAYGEETELVGQRLIGTVVRTLHEIPVLPHDVIEEAARRPYLEGSDLALSEQRVRFTPTQMDVDETSKLWGMFQQTPYALSVSYQASLVLIDGREEPAPAVPVRERTVRVAPFGAPGAPEPYVAGRGPGVSSVAPAESGAASGAASGPGREGAGPAKSTDERTAAEGATSSTKPATPAKTSKATKAAKTTKAAAKTARPTKKRSGGSGGRPAATSPASPARTRKAADSSRRDGGRADEGGGAGGGAGGGGTDGGEG